jgi:LysR family transcriptional regulator (chromosome initiation inhibitor)
MWNDPVTVRTVAAVVEAGTFDAAARRLHVTPSAVSQRVKALETTLGQRLLVRSTPVRPTAAGEAVLRYARRLALLDQEAADDLGVGAAGGARLAVAVNADSLATWFLDALAAVTRDRPLTVELHREDQTRTARMLEDGTVMAAVTAQDAPVPGCTSLALGALEYRAMASADWVARWAPEGVGPSTLARAPRVDYDRDDALQAGWLTDHGVDPSSAPRHLVPSSADFARAVALGVGWGMVPRQHAALHPDLVDLGGATVRTPLWWQRWRTPSTALDALSAAVVDEARRALVSPGAR